MRLALLALPVALNALLASSLAWGYPGPSDPRRWPSNEVTFNLQPSVFPEQSSMWNKVLNGISSWNFVPGADFEVYYSLFPEDVFPTDNNDTLNTIGFVGNIDNPFVLGVTDYRSQGNVYQEADIRLNGNANFDEAALPDSFPPYEVFSLELAVRHEAGHVVGFRGEERREPRVAVMDSLYSWGGLAYSNLHGDDRNGLRSFYPGAGSETDVRVLGWTLKSNYNGRANPVAPPSPQYVSSEQSIQVEYTVENLGTYAYSDTAYFYLSRFPSIVPGFDVKIGATAISIPPALGGDAVVPILTRNRTLTIPCGLDGVHYVGVHAQQALDEDQSDNVSVLTTAEHPESIPFFVEM